MELSSNNDEVVQLLTKLKGRGGAYPPELLAARKSRYLQQVAQISIAAGAGAGIKEVLKAGKGTGLPPVAGTMLETILVAAIVVEASALGYVYREKLAELLNISLKKPVAEESSNPPVIASPIQHLESTATPVMTETGTPIGTPLPVIVINGTEIMVTEVVNPVNTVNAVIPVPTDKNGNQYGLTPLPERTKDPNGGNNDGGGTDNGNHKDNKKP